jgi:hypothetical protein
VAGDVGMIGELAADIARDPAEKSLEPSDLAPSAAHLPRVRVAARQAQRPLRQPMVALAQAKPVLRGEPHQDLAAAVVEARVQGMRDRLRLHRGVDCHPLEARRLRRAGRERRRDGGGEQLLHARSPDALAPACQRARIDRQAVLQIVEAAEELPIRVLDPARAHRLIGEVVGVLQVGEPDHQSRRLAGTARRLVVERPERRLETPPVDQPGQADQRMLQIELIAQPGAEKVRRTPILRPSWTHRKSPENAAANRNPGILRYFVRHKNPFPANSLCLFQVRPASLTYARRARFRVGGCSVIR